MSEDERHTHIVNVPVGTRVTIDDQRRRGPGWFRMFRPIVRRRIWARLSCPAKAVYPVMAERADEQWVVKIPFKQSQQYVGTSQCLGLVELAGVSRSGINRAMRELRRKGLLIIRLDGRGREFGIYQLVPPVVGPVTDDTLNMPPVAHSRVTGDTLNMPPVAHSRVTGDTLNMPPVIGAIKERARESETLLRDSSSRPAAAAVRSALVEAGIGEPTLSELASSGLTADRIRDLAAQNRRGTGVLVNNLRVAVERLKVEVQNHERDELRAGQRRIIQSLSGEDLQAAVGRAWPSLSVNLRSQLHGVSVCQMRETLLGFPSGVAAVCGALTPRELERGGER